MNTSRTTGRRIATGGVSVLAALTIASSAGCSSKAKASSAPAATDSLQSILSQLVSPSPSRPAASTEADSLKAFVASSSSATSAMKSAVADHVTKVDVSDGDVSIYTDLTGDIGSGDSDTAQLIVSGATDWAAQEHKPLASGAGLITVYNQSGSILANGNY